MKLWLCVLSALLLAGCTAGTDVPGSVTPMARAHKGTEDITVIIDEDILSMDTVCVHPCVSSASLAIKLDDLVRFLAKTGNKICIVRPQSPEEA